ncbi:MAG TPA: ATP-binding protein [Clostridiaceae bacterium]|nr:ATP-binding protein [Clostridiaceae bacterium]
MIKRENYLKQIRPLIGNDQIKVLTGIRRGGKSVMLEHIREELIRQGVSPERFIAYNFEEMRNLPLRKAESLFHAVAERMAQIDGKAYLFFDEIQEVRGCEEFIENLQKSYDCEIFLAGSCSDVPAGSFVRFKIFPFSFAEFKEMYIQLYPGAPENEIFVRFFQLGGMPALGSLRMEEDASKLYLKDLFGSLVLQDIVRRNEIRDVELLERVIGFVFAHPGTSLSANYISGQFKKEGRITARETILNYLEYGVKASLFYRIPRHDLKRDKLLTVGDKFYLADHGIREAVFGGQIKEINMILENIVLLELLRRGYRVTAGLTGSSAIDFVCERGDSRIYIQVAYILASPQIEEQEFGAYDAVRDHYPKYVLSMDETDLSQKGIRHRNIRDFLVDPSW